MMTPDPGLAQHPLVRRLWPLREAPAAVRRAAALAAYMEATGVHFSQPATSSELQAVRDWLLAEEFNMPTDVNGHSVTLLAGLRRLVAAPLVSPDLGTKLAWLGQAPCLTCVRAPIKPLRVGFSILARPFAAQSLNAVKLASLKTKIASHIAEKGLDLAAWAGYEVCVTVVAVVQARERRKDVDNMAKGLLDAMQGSIYVNDGLVQHLSVRRVSHDEAAGWYRVTAMPVLDTRADVVDPQLHVGWGTEPEIVADDV